MVAGVVTFRNVEDMAQFCAELVRLGVRFSAVYSGDEYVVTLTGGR